MTNAESTTAAIVAEQGAPVTPDKAVAKKTASRKKRPQDQQARSAKSTKAKGSKKAGRRETSRAKSKGGQILELIGRAKGATLTEIMRATSWQAHSVRGFISTAGNKHGVDIESSKSEAGERVYRRVK